MNTRSRLDEYQEQAMRGAVRSEKQNVYVVD
jgi:hypothetical protein